MPLITFTASTRQKASEVNANFALCVLTDTSTTIAVTHTWSASQTLSGGAIVTGATASGLLHPDSGIEIRKDYAGLSLLQTTNPGNTTNESFVVFGAYSSTGTVRKTASISSMWAVATDASRKAVLRLNAAYSGGDDVSIRLFGNEGVDIFGSSDTTGPGSNVMRVAGAIQLASGGTAAAGTILKTAAQGMLLQAVTGATYDFAVLNPAGSAFLLSNPTGTRTIVTLASATGSAGFNIPHGTAPTAPQDGDVWSTTSGLFIRINGVTKTVTLT